MNKAFECFLDNHTIKECGAWVMFAHLHLLLTCDTSDAYSSF